MTTSPRVSDYNSWTREQLIERLLTLERPRSVNRPQPSPSPSKDGSRTSESAAIDNGGSRPVAAGIVRPKSVGKGFNFANYPKRKVALKFCYAGWEYCGLAYQSDATQLPTVEGVLFEALAKAKLIDVEKGMEGCGWEKCGRTDRGVSAAGNVISLWVRSAIGSASGVEEQKKNEEATPSMILEDRRHDEGVDANQKLPGLWEDFGVLDSAELTHSSISTAEVDSKKPRQELDYVAILNRILPSTIRILAWAPVSPSFSARFSCHYRHYKYFFSGHDLDVSRMREAANRLLGQHDFRNLCKVDAQKQITIFKRAIIRADIQPVEGERGMWVFNLVGTAFLYHQVRHVMAIMFLIGAGLEDPSLISKLMNIVEGAEVAEPGAGIEVVERKPEYQMADALPLMLWDCGYSEQDVNWRTNSYEPTEDRHLVGSSRTGDRRSGSGTENDLYFQLHSIYSRSKIHTVLDKHFLHAAEKFHAPPKSYLPLSSRTDAGTIPETFNYPLGGGTYKRVNKYVPVLERKRLDTVEAINKRWRLGKGSRRADKRAASAEVALEAEGENE